jgi:hypothetical protein
MGMLASGSGMPAGNASSRTSFYAWGLAASRKIIKLKHGIDHAELGSRDCCGDIDSSIFVTGWNKCYEEKRGCCTNAESLHH